MFIGWYALVDLVWSCELEQSSKQVLSMWFWLNFRRRKRIFKMGDGILVDALINDSSPEVSSLFQHRSLTWHPVSMMRRKRAKSLMIFSTRLGAGVHKDRKNSKFITRC